jgi:hypothetical protein
LWSWSPTNRKDIFWYWYRDTKICCRWQRG